VRDWKNLESITASEWLKKVGGDQVYEIVWKPLLHGKFGLYASKVSAVWIWNKLKLRGGSRNKGGAEELAYYKGSFSALANAIAEKIIDLGGEVITEVSAENIEIENKQIRGVRLSNGNSLKVDKVITTIAPALVAELIDPYIDNGLIKRLRGIKYLANICLILDLNHSLSNLYWLNVNDPSFPFVGIIEHTNFISTAEYGDSHMVYLSKYLTIDDPLYKMNKEELLEYSLPYISQMFPEFDEKWINNYYLWKAEFAQPVITKNYSEMIPKYDTPIEGLFMSSMAHIYPEDRGTNYAIREGRRVAKLLLEKEK